MNLPPPMVCDWCGNVDDPAANLPCPCRAYREQATAPPATKSRKRRAVQLDAAVTKPTAPLPILTLDERRAAYTRLDVPVLDVIAAAAAEQQEGAA